MLIDSSNPSGELYQMKDSKSDSQKFNFESLGYNEFKIQASNKKFFSIKNRASN